jgi:hypothetical protein
MAGDAGKAKAAYNDFLTLWKDADHSPQMPPLRKRYNERVQLPGG